MKEKFSSSFYKKSRDQAGTRPLPENRLGRHVAHQLGRSGTAPAPNYGLGRVGGNRADFIHQP